MGGPIFKNKTFFFGYYEGARLRLPQTALNQVPSQLARTQAPVALAPFLNAYPAAKWSANITDGFRCAIHRSMV